VVLVAVTDLPSVPLDEIDLTDPDAYIDRVPHEQFATLRREAPVFWHEDVEGGFWCVTRHADIVAVNRDWETYSSYRGAVFLYTPDDLDMSRLMMLNMDPPEHAKLRKLVNRGFTPRRIRELQEVLARRATAIVDEVIETGACDMVEAVAAELPLQAIAEFLGVPQEDRHLVFKWSNTMIGSDDPEYASEKDETGQTDETMAASAELYAYAQGLAEDRRANPRDDIVSDLVHAEVDGDVLSDTDFNLFFLLLAVAGNETTRNAISHSVLALAENPDQRTWLREDPDRWDTAVEELLRWSTPVMHFRRTATRDTELGGQAIAEGDRIVMWHISGNRDEAVFTDPFRLDLGRTPNDHLAGNQIAFGGGGPHFCLGANLARAEMRVMLEEVVGRLGDFEIDGPVQRLRSNFINGIKHLPVAWNAP
jgi:cholest-4-en-3-one 26-monooxygenase